MTEKTSVSGRDLDPEQLDLIERFVADYNAIDHFLRKELRAEKGVSFTYLVKKFAELHPSWRDSQLLQTIGVVRNAIIHEKLEPFRYVAVPAPAIVQSMSLCRDRLTNPPRAIPTFRRDVKTVAVDDTLSSVLKVVDQREYSQFPVYDKEFVGLLTENGIARWLARHLTAGVSIVEFDDATVRDVLRNEEKRINHQFVARDMRVDDVRGLFASQQLLEAVLITQNGKKTEKLLGIATRWDIIQIA